MMEDLIHLSLHTATDLKKNLTAAEYESKENNYTSRGNTNSVPTMLLH